MTAAARKMDEELELAEAMLQLRSATASPINTSNCGGILRFARAIERDCLAADIAVPAFIAHVIETAEAVEMGRCGEFALQLDY